MKKIYLFFLALLLSIQNFAQQYQVAGTCTMSLGTTTYGPMYSTSTSAATSRVAVIYPATQLTGVAGQALTGIYFKKMTTGNITGTPNLKVYLKETASLDFGASAIDWATTITGATLVYNSSPATAAAGAAGWKQFMFSNNFTYSGAQNLIVLMEYTNTGNTVNTTWEYEYSSPCVVTTNNNTTKYINNTSGTPGASLSSSNYRRPFISFSHTSAAPCTGTVTAGTASASASSACVNVPFNLTLTGATTGSGITYQWQSSPAGANTFTNIAGATFVSYAVANQTAATDYRCVITCTNSGSTQTSNTVTVGQNPLTQCYCAPVYTTGCSDGDNLNSFVLAGAGGSAISDLNTGCNGNGYYDRTTAFSPVNLIAGQTYPVQMNTTYSSPTYEKASIWIDFNDNGLFDTNEKLLTDFALAQSPSFATANIIIPITAQAGVHRMRVRVIYSSTNVNACASATYGEAHDYLVNMQACTTTTPVVTVVPSLLTHNSASVTWLQDAIGANDYLIRYRAVGSTGGWLPAGGPISQLAGAPGSLHTQPLSGLDPATLYEVEVAAVCGTTNIGVYSHNEFTTKCDPTPPNVTFTNITATSAVVNWSPLVASATYQLQWKKVGDPVTAWIGPIDLPNAPANSYTLPSPGYTLTPYTQYEVQVRSTCVGSTTANPWSSLSRFTTERTCDIAPPGLTILELKPTSAKVQWEPYNGPDATGTYVLRYRKVGIPGWTNVTVSTNIYTLTGLTELTKYEMEVANICTGTPANFTLPYYFTTPTVIYCQMGANNTSGEYISKVTVAPNGKPQMINASAGSTYTDYTTDPLAQIELIQGSGNNQLTIDKVVTADAGVVAWIDFDRNGEFDINERILVSGPNSAATASATFNVPSNAFVSNADHMYVVMRVALMKGGIPVNCTNFDSGEVEDYTVRISKKSATNLLNQTDILIYPNPVSTVLNVKNISKRANYKIYSASGQLVSSGLILNNKIDVHALINGMYVIDIQDGSSSVQKKFIKE